MPSITVKHNVEMGHRLSQQPDSKCFHLHGHSWWVELTLFGHLDKLGMVAGLNFAEVKAAFREFLDTNYDHHLLLNPNDPLLEIIDDFYMNSDESDKIRREWGITLTDNCDPTVENFARIIYQWARMHWPQTGSGGVSDINVKVWEAATNRADWGWLT